jgi:hypothetical protein
LVEKERLVVRAVCVCCVCCVCLWGGVPDQQDAGRLADRVGYVRAADPAKRCVMRAVTAIEGRSR